MYILIVLYGIGIRLLPGSLRPQELVEAEDLPKVWASIGSTFRQYEIVGKLRSTTPMYGLMEIDKNPNEKNEDRGGGQARQHMCGQRAVSPHAQDMTCSTIVRHGKRRAHRSAQARKRAAN